MSTVLGALKQDVAINTDSLKVFGSSLANLVSQSTFAEDMHDLRIQIKSLSNELRITKSDLDRYQNEESLKTNLRQSEWTTLEDKIRLLQSANEASQSDLLNKLSEMERAQRQGQYELTSISAKVESAALLQHDIRKLTSKYDEVSTTIEDMKLGILKLKEALPRKSNSSGRFEDSVETQLYLPAFSHKPETTDTLPTSIDSSYSAVDKTNSQCTDTEAAKVSQLTSTLASTVASADNGIIDRREGSIGSILESDTSDDDIIPADDNYGSPEGRHSTLDELEKSDENDTPLEGKACLAGEDADDVSAGVTIPIRANDVSKSGREDGEEDHASVSSMSAADGLEPSYHRPHPDHRIDLSEDSFEDELIPADDPMALGEYQPITNENTIASDDSSEDLLIPAEPLPEDRETEVDDDPGAEAGLTREDASSKALESSQPQVSASEESTDDYRAQHLKPNTTPTIISDHRLPNLILDNPDEVLDFGDFPDDEIIPADRGSSVPENKRTDSDIGIGGVPSPPEPNISPEVNTARDKKSPAPLSPEISIDSHHDRKDRSLLPLSRRSLTSSPVPEPLLTTKALNLTPSASNSQSQLPPLQTSGLSIRCEICTICMLLSIL